MSPEWNPEFARHVAQTFCRVAGLHDPDLELVRHYQNAIFKLPKHKLVLRVYGPEGPGERAHLMVSFARLLERREFPSVRLSPQFVNQPIEILGTPVSVWEWIDEDVPRIRNFRAFGALLRAFHSLTDSVTFPVEAFDPIMKIRRRLDRLRRERRLPDSYVRVLEAATERAAGLVAHLSDGCIGSGLLHGDALIGNTIQSNGTLILLDFDSVACGAREWDLAPTFVTATRFRQNSDPWKEFLDGYGAAVTEPAGVEAAGVVKQLSMTTALCLSSGLTKAIDDEINLRIRCWADWDFNTRWYSPF
jgi:thiamine kinase-like enzyme